MRDWDWEYRRRVSERGVCRGTWRGQEAGGACGFAGCLSRTDDGADDLCERSGGDQGPAVVELPCSDEDGRHDVCGYGLPGISLHPWDGRSSGDREPVEE